MPGKKPGPIPLTRTQTTLDQHLSSSGFRPPHCNSGLYQVVAPAPQASLWHWEIETPELSASPVSSSHWEPGPQGLPTGKGSAGWSSSETGVLRLAHPRWWPISSSWRLGRWARGHPLVREKLGVSGLWHLGSEAQAGSSGPVDSGHMSINPLPTLPNLGRGLRCHFPARGWG